MKTKLTDAELWQAMTEAEARKADRTLTIDARVRSFETYALCLREAHSRGFDYGTLKAAANGAGGMAYRSKTRST